MTRSFGPVELIVTAGILVGGLAATVAAGPAESREVKQLKEVERTWVRSLETGDAGLLATIVDSELTFIGPDGEYEEREAYLAGYRALPTMGIKVEKVDVFDARVRTLGDVGVVTSRVQARVKTPQGSITEHVRFTRVYKRRPDGWKMVAGQGTRLASPGH